MVRLENVLKISLQDILKMSWRHLEDVFKTSWRRLEDALKRSWRRLENVLKTSWRRIAKTNILVLTKTSWRRLEDVFWRRKAKANIFVLIKTSWRRLLKTSPEDKDERRLQDVFKTSSSRQMFAGLWLYLSSSLWGIFLRSNVFRKRVDQKKISTSKNLNCISCSMACKIFFYFKFPDILEQKVGDNLGVYVLTLQII